MNAMPARLTLLSAAIGAAACARRNGARRLIAIIRSHLAGSVSATLAPKPPERERSWISVFTVDVTAMDRLVQMDLLRRSADAYILGTDNYPGSMPKWGCYVGQEVIVRVMHRGGGRVARKLVRLDIAADGAMASTVPAPGSRITSGDRDIGRITFSGPSLEYPLFPGVQDRLSWIAQLAAIAQAAVLGLTAAAEGKDPDRRWWRPALGWAMASCGVIVLAAAAFFALMTRDHEKSFRR